MCGVLRTGGDSLLCVDHQVEAAWGRSDLGTVEILQEEDVALGGKGPLGVKS